MGIQDIILKNSEEFARIIATLMKSKSALHWDKALLLIQENREDLLWHAMNQEPFPSDENKIEVMEFLIRLRFHELDILKIKGKEIDDEKNKLQNIISKFTALHPENFYFELEGMKQKLKSL